MKLVVDTNVICSELQTFVRFIPAGEYAGFIRDACMLAQHLSENELAEFMDDIDFFALALKEECPIWSQDRLFKRQSKVTVVTTAEVARFL